jgi:hypothetical protein
LFNEVGPSMDQQTIMLTKQEEFKVVENKHRYDEANKEDDDLNVSDSYY